MPGAKGRATCNLCLYWVQAGTARGQHAAVEAVVLIRACGLQMLMCDCIRKGCLVCWLKEGC